jgi:hypothetical protein
MPKRLETAREQIDFAQKTAVSEEVNNILQEITRLQGELNNYPAGSQQYNYFSGKISELRNSLQSVVQQSGGGLTYEDLSKSSPLLQNLRLPTEQFGIPEKEQIRYPSPQELEGLSEQDRAIAESEAEKARGEVVDFAEKRIPEEIQRTQQERDEQARAEKAEKLRADKEKQRVEEQGVKRVERDLVESPVWANLTDKTSILGANGVAGKLTEVEKRVIMNMLKTAPTDIESDERFDEFMSDLLNVVEQSRDPKSFSFQRGSSIAKFAAEIPQEILQGIQKIYETQGEEKGNEFSDSEQEFWDSFEDKISGEGLIQRIMGMPSSDMYGGRDAAIGRLLDKGFVEQIPATEPNQAPRLEPTQAWLDYLKNNALQLRMKNIEDFLSGEAERKRIKKDVSEVFPGDSPETGQIGIIERRQGEEIAAVLTSGIKQLVESKYPEINLSGSGTEMPEMAWEGPQIRELKSELLGENLTDERKQEILNELSQLGYSPSDEFDIEGIDKPEKGYDLPDKKDKKKELKERIKGLPLSPAVMRVIEDATGLKFKDKPPVKTIRDEQDIDERLYEAYKGLTTDIDTYSGKLDDLVSQGYGDAKMGATIENPEGVRIEDLNRVPGHQFIKQWMRKAHNLKGDSELKQEHLPTNSEVLDILDEAQQQIALKEFLEEGGRAERYGRQADSNLSELALAKQFKDSGYSAKKMPSEIKGREREGIKDESETVSVAADADPLYNADLSAWLDVVDVKKARDMGRELTSSQNAAGKTWYTYDWWFQNVYEGDSQNLADRIRGIKQDPDSANQEAEGQYSKRLEEYAEEELPGDLNDFEWMNEDLAKSYMDATYPSLSDSAKKTQYKLIKKMMLLDKIAEFIKSDPETKTWLREKAPSWRDAMGQYQRYPYGQESGANVPDVANIIWNWIAIQFARNTRAGLPYIQNLIEASGNPSQSIRDYIRIVGRRAVLGEMRKQENLMKNIRTVELDKQLGDAAEFLNSEAADDDPERSQAAQVVNQSINEDPEMAVDPDSVIEEILNNPFLMGQTGLDAVIRKLPEQYRQLWAFLYGEAGSRDIWGDVAGGPEQGKKLRLDVATRQWSELTGERVDPEAFRKRKQRLVNLAINTMAKKMVDSPELGALVRLMRDLNNDSTEAQQEAQSMIQQDQNRNIMTDLPEESGLEGFEGTEGGDIEYKQQAPVAVNEPVEDADQLERVENIRKRRPKKDL